MRERLSFRPFAVFLVGLASAVHAAPATTLLPASKDVSGWSVYPKTLTSCPKASDLHEIYDGGDGLYIKNGVVEAALQLYRKSPPSTGKATLTAEVTVHRMKSASQAKSFGKYWSKQTEPKNILNRPAIKDGAFLAHEGSTVAGYLWRGAYFVTVTINATGKDAEAAAMGFLKAVAAKVKR